MAVRATAKKKQIRKPVESSGQFLKIIKEWQKLEDETIKFSKDMMKKSKNPLIRMTMDMIKHDSEKHKTMQQALIDSITKEAIHLTPDELASISSALNKHMAAEAKSLELADEALDKSELFTTHFILSMLIADETKHHNILGNLNELKRRTILVT
jgi:hypothetical protein